MTASCFYVFMIDAFHYVQSLCLLHAPCIYFTVFFALFLPEWRINVLRVI